MTRCVLNRSLGSIIITCSMLLMSCAKYKPQPLLTAHGIPQRQENVTVNVQALTESDCKHYFSRKIVSKGYQPLHVTIVNNGATPYILDAQNVGLQLEHITTVAQSCHLHTAKRIVAWAIPSLFIWPFIIPAAVDGAKSTTANKKLSLDFAERSISADSYIVVPGHSTVNRVMFVRRENFQNSFELMLAKRDYPNEKLSFQVSI